MIHVVRLRPWLAVASFLATLAAVVVPAAAAEPTPTIVVIGSGKASAAPDTAQLHAGVVAANAQAESAIAVVSARATAVLAALRAQGVAEKDVQTSGVSLRPLMSRREPRGPGGGPGGGPGRGPGSRDAPRITGYEARIDHRVNVLDVARLGRVIDAVIAAGANDLGGIRFSVRNDDKLLEKARRLAVADARKTAETLAAEAGVGVGRVLAIEEIEGGGPGPITMMLRAEAGGVPVAPGEVTATARVRVSFGLESKKAP